MEATAWGWETRVQGAWWLRGSARVEGDWIVLDRTSAQSYFLDEVAEEPLVTELAAIRTPREAADFASRYGLLRIGARDSGELRERWSAWEGAARRLSDILAVYRALTNALAGEQEATETLWQDLLPRILSQPVGRAVAREGGEVVIVSAGPQNPETDANLFRLAGNWLIVTINNGLEESRELQTTMNLGQKAPGEFVIAPSPPTLLALAYYQAMLHLVRRDPLERCQECQRFFIVTDRRQRHCATACATRARQRRWAQRKRAGVVVEDQAVP